MVHADMEEDRRTSVRHRTLREAKVVLHDWSTIDCIVRNISDGGAHLDFSDPVALPDHFEVLFVGAHTLVPADRVWERGAAAGVKFTGPEKQAPLRRF